MKIAVIGMGYVGATLAQALHPHHEVIGIDPSPRQINEPGMTGGFWRAAALRNERPIDCYILCVGTPIGSQDALVRATEQVAAHMADGALVIVRSTVPVGTTRNVIKPILEASGLLHYQLAVCPERTIEGNALAELAQLPQIIAAETPEAVAKASEVFSPLGCKAYWAPTFETAEMAKLLANSWRDVTFAYANQVALLAEAYGVSARDAILAANWNYPRCAIPMPGPVGGPCLTKDSQLLVGPHYKKHRVIESARANNAFLIHQIVDRLEALAPTDRTVECALLGTAFKGQPETDDVRDSPSTELWRVLTTDLKWNVTTVDPLAPADILPCQGDIGEDYDVVIVATNAPMWRVLNLRAALAPGGLIYDCCGGVDDFDHRFGG